MIDSHELLQEPTLQKGIFSVVFIHELTGTSLFDTGGRFTASAHLHREDYRQYNCSEYVFSIQFIIFIIPLIFQYPFKAREATKPPPTSQYRIIFAPTLQKGIRSSVFFFSLVVMLNCLRYQK